MPSILIVDDDQGQRTVLQTILKREGYTIETAENGVAALEKIEDNLFDVIVSDMRMAQMSGRELLHEIKSRDPDLPVLITLWIWLHAKAHSITLKNRFRLIP